MKRSKSKLRLAMATLCAFSLAAAARGSDSNETDVEETVSSTDEGSEVTSEETETEDADAETSISGYLAENGIPIIGGTAKAFDPVAAPNTQFPMASTAPWQYGLTLASAQAAGFSHFTGIVCSEVPSCGASDEFYEANVDAFDLDYSSLVEASHQEPSYTSFCLAANTIEAAALDEAGDVNTSTVSPGGPTAQPSPPTVTPWPKQHPMRNTAARQPPTPGPPSSYSASHSQQPQPPARRNNNRGCPYRPLRP